MFLALFWNLNICFAFVIVYDIVSDILSGSGGQSFPNDWQDLAILISILSSVRFMIPIVLLSSRYPHQWLAQHSFFLLSCFFKLACLIKSHCWLSLYQSLTTISFRIERDGSICRVFSSNQIDWCHWLLEMNVLKNQKDIFFSL